MCVGHLTVVVRTSKLETELIVDLDYETLSAVVHGHSPS